MKRLTTRPDTPMSQQPNYDYDDDVTFSETTVTDPFWDETHRLPDYIVDRTENILSIHPLTNQNIILDLARWWFEHGGNCAIYNWCVHHLDVLENDAIAIRDRDVYDAAIAQAEEIGLDVGDDDE